MTHIPDAAVDAASAAFTAGDDFDNLLSRAIAAALDAMGASVVVWRSMDSAPLDGREVDLWTKRRETDCHWHLGKWLKWDCCGTDDEPHWCEIKGPVAWAEIPVSPSRDTAPPATPAQAETPPVSEPAEDAHDASAGVLERRIASMEIGLEGNRSLASTAHDRCQVLGEFVDKLIGIVEKQAERIAALEARPVWTVEQQATILRAVFVLLDVMTYYTFNHERRTSLFETEQQMHAAFPDPAP